MNSVPDEVIDLMYTIKQHLDDHIINATGYMARTANKDKFDFNDVTVYTRACNMYFNHLVRYIKGPVQEIYNSVVDTEHPDNAAVYRASKALLKHKGIIFKYTDKIKRPEETTNKQ